jgi:predicted  nucleic acid-binding Zn-ribbon protein
MAEIVQLNKPKTTKERLVNQFIQEMGGATSYWNKVPAEQLRALNEAIEDKPEAKAALANLVSQLQDARQTNLRLNRHNFGLTQTASKYERVADSLTKLNAELERQKDELLKQIRDMVDCLTDYDKSEIRLAVKTIQKHINAWIKH